MWSKHLTLRLSNPANQISLPPAVHTSSPSAPSFNIPNQTLPVGAGSFHCLSRLSNHPLPEVACARWDNLFHLQCQKSNKTQCWHLFFPTSQAYSQDILCGGYPTSLQWIYILFKLKRLKRDLVPHYLALWPFLSTNMSHLAFLAAYQMHKSIYWTCPHTRECSYCPYDWILTACQVLLA